MAINPSETSGDSSPVHPQFTRPVGSWSAIMVDFLAIKVILEGGGVNLVCVEGSGRRGKGSGEQD